MKVRVKLKRTIRTGKKKRYEYPIVSAEYTGNWRSVSDQKAFRDMIHQKYPGLTIVVYGPSR